MEWPAEERSTSGATMRTSPNSVATSASAAIPGLYMPSSLQMSRRMSFFFPPMALVPLIQPRFRSDARDADPQSRRRGRQAADRPGNRGIDEGSGLQGPLPVHQGEGLDQGSQEVGGPR